MCYRKPEHARQATPMVDDAPFHEDDLEDIGRR
jgi:hypothetical protein